TRLDHRHAGVAAGLAALAERMPRSYDLVGGTMGRPSKLTSDSRETILAAIRAGAFDHVAASAAGVDAGTFRRWMADERPTFRAFRAEVGMARAEARSVAEARVFKENPLAWLRFGPGRDRPDAPGWTENARQEHGGQIVLQTIA